MKKTYLSAVLKILVILGCGIGTGICFFTPSGFMGGARLFLYFTMQSNVWIAVLCAILLVRMFLRKGKAETPLLRVLKFVFTVSISLTGAVYCFVLAPTMAYAWSPSNVLLHVVTPLASLADYFLFDVKQDPAPENRLALYALIPPLYYVVFAGIGYVCNWKFGATNYPYFFLNWGSPAGAFGFCNELPFIGTFYWVAILGVLVYLFARLLLFVSRKIASRNRES